MDSLFLCPVCGKALDRQETGYRCPGGHSFDKAAAGYVHLLPANKKHAKDPGDDKGMAAARNRFLSGGWYAPLRDRLAELALRYTPDRCVVLDAGCGEGYYTAGVYAALKKAGKQVKLAGVDLSKHALKRAAKREKDGEFAVASVYGLPVADRCVHLLLNCFSPWPWRNSSGSSGPAGSTSMWCRGRAICGSSRRSSMTSPIPTRKS